jgi:peptide chain release factor 1
MKSLIDALDAQGKSEEAESVNRIRKEMTGTGERSDKRRTWRFKDDVVHDHKTGKTASCTRLMKGDFQSIWPRE